MKRSILSNARMLILDPLTTQAAYPSGTWVADPLVWDQAHLTGSAPLALNVGARFIPRARVRFE